VTQTVLPELESNRNKVVVKKPGRVVGGTIEVLPATMLREEIRIIWRHAQSLAMVDKTVGIDLHVGVAAFNAHAKSLRAPCDKRAPIVLEHSAEEFAPHQVSLP
jgi:hypothetical protein